MSSCRPIVLALLGACLVQFSLAATSVWAGPYFDAVTADEPVAYWRLGESNTDMASNIGLLGQADVGHGIYTDGVDLAQPSLVMGETDASARMTTGGRMTTEPFEKFDDVAGFGGTGSTVEFWTCFQSVPGGFANLVGDGEGGLDFNMMVYAGAGGFIRPHIQTDEGFSSIDSVRRVRAGEVIHVVSTWEEDGDFLLYLDGEEADVNLSAGTNPIFGELANRDNRVYIGQDDREPSPQAWIDEAALYNYALSPERVREHYDAGQGAACPIHVDPPNPNINVSLSSDVARPGTYADGHATQDGMVNIIRQIPNSAAANVVPYTADNAGPTIDVAPWIVDGGTAGGFGSDTHGRGGNLFIPGDDESNTPHEGFGGHANWIATFDLNEIREDILIDPSGRDLRLTGRYGSWGGIGDASAPAGVTQGLIFVDGQRVDSMAETTHNVPTPGGVDSPSQAFDILIPAGAQYLTLALMSGPDSTFWDDGVFRNVRLRVADPVLDSQAGLVSFWNFDESNTGTDDVYDQPGGNTGEFVSTAERTDGLVGTGAARFNNTGGDSVTVGPGNDNSFSFDTAITVEALIQSEWNGEDYDEIFRKEDGGNRILLSFQNDANNGGANPPVDPGPVLSFGLNIEGYGELDMPLDGLDGRPTPDDLTDGSIRHVVATYDSESGEKSIWIDGELLWDVNLGAGSLITSGGSTPAQIGNVGSGEPFTGVIDEVAIWSRALSAEEVAQHYANVLAGGNYFGSVDPCDYDGDGMLSVTDLNLLREEVKAGTNNPTFDVNDDGFVNRDDIQEYVTSPTKLNTYIGDVNLDGEFTSGDLVLVFQAGKYETGAEDANWQQGDWDGNGMFGSSDLVFAFQDGGYELGPRPAMAVVPEPASLSLLLLGTLLILPRRRTSESPFS